LQEWAPNAGSILIFQRRHVDHKAVFHIALEQAQTAQTHYGHFAIGADLPALAAGHPARFGLAGASATACSGTGQILPWFLQIEGEVAHRNMALTLSTNDAELELQAVSYGQVIGQLSGVSATSLVHEGRLVPLFTQHLADHMHVYIY
jgi:hypothetical protein